MTHPNYTAQSNRASEIGIEEYESESAACRESRSSGHEEYKGLLTEMRSSKSIEGSNMSKRLSTQNDQNQ